MAMLAEPRKKQKWSMDPRNSAWSKDESKFGQKMLERMGWSKGKGLGVQEQGNTEHIKVRVKNNTLGLGAAINYEDSWLAHQDDFNQLLAELNNCHGQAESEPAGEQKTTFSLEEKSRSSRKRVHYMKFAKGKDLSSRSEDDLSCIFGKRQTAKTEVYHLAKFGQTSTGKTEITYCHKGYSLPNFRSPLQLMQTLELLKEKGIPNIAESAVALIEDAGLIAAENKALAAIKEVVDLRLD